MAAKTRLVRWKKVRERNVKQNYNGERSPYWDWLQNHGKRGEDGELIEFAEANPDVVQENDPVEKGTVNRTMMKAAIQTAKLSRREKAVLNCLGIQGFSEDKTAEVLGLSRRSVRTLLARAQKKCEKIYVAKMANSGHVSEEDV